MNKVGNLAFFYLLNFEDKLDSVVRPTNLNAIHQYNFKITQAFIELATVSN